MHAIVRRLDDDYCDPVELRADSTLGVPGLVQAWRARETCWWPMRSASAYRVAGAARLPAENLPAAARRTARDAALATWWCGEAAALADARRRLDVGVIKPAYARAAMAPVFTSELDVSARRAWEQRLGNAPDDYVVEEFLPLSYAPVWHNDQIESRALMLRVFLITDGQGDYRVLPGGLSRIAGNDPGIVSSGRGGSSSKDTWVVATAAPSRTPSIVGRARTRESLGERVTSSRAAENLFWLGRYAERSENCARLLRSMLSRLADGPSRSDTLRPAFVRIAERHGLLRPKEADAAIDQPSDAALARALLEGMLNRSERRGLAAWTLKQTVRVAGAVRDRLSTDNWRVLNKLMQLFTTWPATGGHLNQALEVLDDALVSLVAVGGLEMAHMTRDQGWRFLSLGRHLERVQFSARTVLDTAPSAGVADASLLEWLLELSDSVLTYRVRYVQRPEWHSVMDLILFDERNPRSPTSRRRSSPEHVRLLPDAPLGNTCHRARSHRLQLPQHRQRQRCRRTRADAGAVPRERRPRGRPPVGHADAPLLQPCGRRATGNGGGMSVRYRIEHDTRYTHNGMASTSQHVACLKPRSTARQRLLWHTLDIAPMPSAVRDRMTASATR